MYIFRQTEVLYREGEGMELIAFSGTHGTGKTTQAYALASKLKKMGKSVVVLDELARECPLPINKEATAATQHWILAAQIKKELKLMSRYNAVITDRCIFDTIAYGMVLGLLSTSLAKAYEPYVSMYYSRIFVLNPQVFSFQTDDGVRDMDVAFRKNIHDCLVHIYDTYKVDFTMINSQEQLDGIKI